MEQVNQVNQFSQANDPSDKESLDIVNNYLKQISGNTNENNTIVNNIHEYVGFTQSEQTEELKQSNHISNTIDVDNILIDKLPLDGNMEQLGNKLEIQLKIEQKINENIEKEKLLLKISQEKLAVELKLLETIKARQNLENSSSTNVISNQPNLLYHKNIDITQNLNYKHMVQKLRDDIDNENQNAYNVDSDTNTTAKTFVTPNSETKVTKGNPVFLRNIKR